ncbi:hypothetical protein Ancab_017112 [Ancistrocladus abbreviatus]
MVIEKTPRLGKEVALKALKEWGQPKSRLTHLIFCSTAGVDMPGCDYQLTKMLGLNSSINRIMIYQQGCYVGGIVLRIAIDVVKNKKLISASQTLVLNSENAMALHLREEGLTFHLLKDVPILISNNTEDILVDAFKPLNINDWNSLFYITHPGGRAILDGVEKKLGLDKDKMKESQYVLSEYGNLTVDNDNGGNIVGGGNGSGIINGGRVKATIEVVRVSEPWWGW